VNKRDRVLSILDDGGTQDGTPAGFFIHFDPEYHRGQAAIDKHLEFFRYTGMDFVKIQFEHPFPVRSEIERARDWDKMPLYGADFYEAPLKVVEDLVRAAKQEALVIMTLYSPFMCAGQTVRHEQTVGHEVITRQIHEDPAKVKKGIETIAESLMLFVKGCIDLGIDGFYASTQGGESGRFADPALFDTCIKPFDLVLMEEMNRACAFNILHVCDFHAGYGDLTPFLDYPGHIVNCSLELGDERVSAKELSRLFGRPFMGGMDRKGALVSGSPVEIEEAVAAAMDDAPDRFILGADCTLPSDIDWRRIRTAISAAHVRRRAQE
jgi:uroporphyrinogen decarboxylase